MLGFGSSISELAGSLSLKCLLSLVSPFHWSLVVKEPWVLTWTAERRPWEKTTRSWASSLLLSCSDIPCIYSEGYNLFSDGWSFSWLLLKQSYGSDNCWVPRRSAETFRIGSDTKITSLRDRWGVLSVAVVHKALFPWEVYLHFPGHRALMLGSLLKVVVLFSQLAVNLERLSFICNGGRIGHFQAFCGDSHFLHTIYVLYFSTFSFPSGEFPWEEKKKKHSSFSCQLIPAYVGETRLLPLSPRSTTELLVKEAWVSLYVLQVIHQAPLDLLVL